MFIWCAQINADSEVVLNYHYKAIQNDRNVITWLINSVKIDRSALYSMLTGLSEFYDNSFHGRLSFSLKVCQLTIMGYLQYMTSDF